MSAVLVTLNLLNTVCVVVVYLCYRRAARERDQLLAERKKVASGKLTCADCNSILARW